MDGVRLDLHLLTHSVPPRRSFDVERAIRQRLDAHMRYSDEDKLNQDGHRCDPDFKPDLSPEQLLPQNYFSHFGVYRRSLVLSVGGFRPGDEGSQDDDL